MIPEAEVNLHFTGDAHAVASAHNLLSALTHNAVQRGQLGDVPLTGVIWPLLTNMPDRSLRDVVIGLGGSSNAPLVQSKFWIDSASEVMAVLALSNGLEDLRDRLERLVVAFDRNRQPVTAKDVGAVGPMMALLRRAIEPNLVQTSEGQPALVHTGPFANIAHGCSSVIADRVGLSTADYVITEAGFGADLGFEKFIDIKCRTSGLKPNAAVVVSTIRALKWHGGVARNQLEAPNMDALQKGFPNLAHAISLVNSFGVPAVVAINRFPNDPPDEIRRLKVLAREAGAREAVESLAFAEGGEGALDLASAVETACTAYSKINYQYPLAASLREKVEALAIKVYNAADVVWEPGLNAKLRRFQELGWGELPVCMAKTHLSISHDPRLYGVPGGYTFPITDFQISAGAGFVYTLAGRIQTLMGLPRDPNALGIDVNAQGEIVGLV